MLSRHDYTKKVWIRFEYGLLENHLKISKKLIWNWKITFQFLGIELSIDYKNYKNQNWYSSHKYPKNWKLYTNVWMKVEYLYCSENALKTEFLLLDHFRLFPLWFKNFQGINASLITLIRSITLEPTDIIVENSFN